MSTDPQIPRDASSQALADLLREVLGSNRVIDAPEECAHFSTDVYTPGKIAALVARPDSPDQVADTVRTATESGYAVVPRGGGMSYTGGYTPARTRSVILDLSDLNRIIEINEDDLVITVEAGVTWKQIYNALSPLGLRLPFFGTFSGARATVGGGLSNGALFMGTGRYGTAAEMVVGLELIAADGRRIRTGQAAFSNGRPAFRTYGPDLTGLFTHDAGALGIKVAASFRMMEAPKFEDALSYAFADEAAATAALSHVARSGAVEEAYIFDPATTARSLEPGRLKDDIKRLGKLMRQEGSLVGGLKSGAKAALAGRSFVDESLYTLHLICAGRSEASVRADLEICRERLDRHGGSPIANTIPKAARSSPFEPLNGILGSDGERWAALNAKVPHSDAPRLIEATQSIIEPFRERMAEHGVTMSFLYIAISNHVFSYEPVLRWYDEWLPVHRRTPEPEYLRTLKEPEPNPAARALVAEIRSAIVRCFAEFGAASNQIGKTYPLLASMHPETRNVLWALKQELDPKGLMNPGALGKFGP